MPRYNCISKFDLTLTNTVKTFGAAQTLAEAPFEDRPAADEYLEKAWDRMHALVVVKTDEALLEMRDILLDIQRTVVWIAKDQRITVGDMIGEPVPMPKMTYRINPMNQNIDVARELYKDGNGYATDLAFNIVFAVRCYVSLLRMPEWQSLQDRILPLQGNIEAYGPVDGGDPYWETQEVPPKGVIERLLTKPWRTVGQVA